MITEFERGMSRYMKIMFTKFKTSRRIKALKSEARDLRCRMAAIRGQTDCGDQMLSYFNPSYARYGVELERILRELAVIDPEFPQSVNKQFAAKP